MQLPMPLRSKLCMELEQLAPGDDVARRMHDMVSAGAGTLL